MRARYTLRSRRTVLLVCFGFLFGTARTDAQEPSPSASPKETRVPNAPVADEATEDRIVVTGSYLPSAETESELPVTVYTV